MASRAHVPQETANAYSLDVECVATGTGHNARSVAQIALLDRFEQVVLNLYIKPTQPIVSCITPLTGDSRDLDCCRLTPEPLEVHLGGSICPLRKSFWYHRHRLTPELLEARGTSLEAALQTLRQCLPRNAVLVGQNINQDVQWLDLREGIDFESMVDLAGLYRVWNPRFKSWSLWSQDYLCNQLMGWNTAGQSHDAVYDSIKSMRLYHLYHQLQQDPANWKNAQEALLAGTPEPSFARQNSTFDGVCMGNRKTCRCGDPFFS